VADPKKIAVGGHSYGAFMTANLLAHAPHLFCCGIARSGAYNRTLTPFGFQVFLAVAYIFLSSITHELSFFCPTVPSNLLSHLFFDLNATL